MKNNWFFIILSLILSLSFPCFSDVFGTISGKVIDEETGAGIEDVRVLLYKGISTWTERSTNVEGDFIIDKLLPGTYGIEFCPPRPYAWDWYNNFSFDESMSVYEGMQSVIIEKWKNTYIIKKCKKGGTIRIKAIETNTNTPVPDVNIYFKRGVNLGLIWGNNKIKTDNSGNFELDRLADAKCDIYLTKDGYWVKHVVDLEVNYDRVSELIVNYDAENKTKIYGGIICRDSGKPIANNIVIIKSLDNKDWSTCVTNSNGKFIMKDMVPGNYEVTIKKSTTFNDEKLSKKVMLNKDQSMNVSFFMDCI